MESYELRTGMPDLLNYGNCGGVGAGQPADIVDS